MRWFAALSVSAICVAFSGGPGRVARGEDAPADTAPAAVSYYKDIRPTFQEHCQGCHQPAKPLGGLVMTSHAALMKGGDSGEDVVAGEPDESYLLEQLLPSGNDPPLMPKDRPPLAASQVELIRRWIAEGAKDDTPAATTDAIDQEHPPVYQSRPLVTALDYSPDGKLLAVSGYHEVLLHAADGSALVARLVGLSERIESVAFSPDGKRLAVTGGSPCRFGEIQVWNIDDHTLTLSLSVTYDTTYGVSWSPDGTKLAFGCADNSVRAIAADTGLQVLFQGAHSDWVLDTVFSKDASHLVSVSRDRSMKLTEVATQRFVDNITSITPGALKGGLIAVDRRPNEDELLIGGSDGQPKLYQMYRTKARVIGDDFNLLRQYDAMPGRVFDVDFSADGNQFVACSSHDGGGEVRVYKTAESGTVSRLESQNGGMFAVAFAPDGKQVAAGGFDGMVRILDAATGSVIKEFVPVPMANDAVAAK